MTDLHRFTIEHREPKWGGSRYRAVCLNCDWRGDESFSAEQAADDFRRHKRVLREERGIFECGCKPGDLHPMFGYVKQWRQCKIHRKPYIPKNKPRPKHVPEVSTREILDALEKKHTSGHYDRHHPWAYFEELRVDTGWAHGYGANRKSKMRQIYDSQGEPRFHDDGRPMMKRVSHNAQGIDAYAMAMWSGKKFERIAYEVKVTRSDFLNEIKMPWKREIAMELSNSFYYVTPPGLLKTAEIPEGCGLIECHPSGHLRTVLKAPYRNEDVTDLPESFVASMVRQLNKP